MVKKHASTCLFLNEAKSVFTYIAVSVCLTVYIRVSSSTNATTFTSKKMKGYSKIKLTNDNKTRSMSMDFSDQTIITPRFQKLISNNKPTTIITQSHGHGDDDDDYSHYSSNNPQEQQVDTFPNDQILTKSQQSVATNSTPNDVNAKSSRFKIEKQNSTGRTLHISVLRALSIRRSSSVSERYARIHDHYSNTFDFEDCDEEQEEDMQETRSKDKTKKQNKTSILKVCKRIFGL